MPDEPFILKPGDCFYSPNHGLQHYYQQREEFVLHINTDSLLINTLDKDFLRDYPDGSTRVFHLITENEFLDYVSQVMSRWQLPISVQLPMVSN